MNALSLSKIRIDGETQPRAEIDERLVFEYAEAFTSGASLPPVVVFLDGVDYWLADGFHRYHAARQAKRKAVDAEIKKGTKRDALLYAVGANATHGQRRTNEDKRRAILILLNDEEWGQKANTWIAEKCVVDETTVRRLRESLRLSRSEGPAAPTERISRTKHGTVTTMNVENIGRSRSLPLLPEVEVPIKHFSNARIFAEMALAQLRSIADDDPEFLEVLTEVRDWIDQRLKRRAAK